MDWFLYDNSLRHERVNNEYQNSCAAGTNLPSHSNVVDLTLSSRSSPSYRNQSKSMN